MHYFLFNLFLLISVSGKPHLVSSKMPVITSIQTHSTFFNNGRSTETEGKEAPVYKKKTKEKKNKKRKFDEKSANRKAIWGFIFGCASILLFPLFAIPGLILSNDALWEERMQPRILTRRNKTFAYLGKIFSYLGIFMMILALLFFAVLISFLNAWG